jgi:hypothetical protein
MANQGKLDFLLNFRTNIGGVSDKIKKEVKGLVKDGEVKFNKLSNTMGTTMGSTRKLSQAFEALKSSSPFDLLQRGADRFGAAFGPSAQFIIQQFTSVGAIIAMTAAKAFHAASQMDKTMFLLRNTTSTTAAQHMELSGAIHNVTMELGLGQDQAGRMAVGLTKAGFAVDEVAAAMHSLGEVNHATGVDTGQLVDMYARMHKQFGITSKGIEEMNEHFFRTQRVSTISMESLLAGVDMISEGVITYYDNLSESSGVSKEQMIKDLTSVYAMIEPLGQDGAALMRTFMANSRDLTSEQFHQIRIMAGAHAGAMEKAIKSGNLDDAFAELLDGIKTTSKPMAEMNTMMEQVFGIPGGGRLISVLKQSEMGAEGLAKQLERVRNSTSLAEAAEHLELSSMLYQMWNRISAALEPVGQALLQILHPILEVFTVIVEYVGKVLKILQPILSVIGGILGWVIAIVAGFVTLAVIAKVVLAVAGFIGAAIAFIATNVIAIMASLGVVLGIFTVIAGVVWALNWAVKKLFGKSIIEIFKLALEKVGELISGIINKIMWVLDKLKGIWDFFFGSKEKEIDVTVNEKKGDTLKTPVTVEEQERDRGRQLKASRKLAQFAPTELGRAQSQEEADRLEAMKIQPPVLPLQDYSTMIKPITVGETSQDLHKSMMSSNTVGDRSSTDLEAIELLKEIRDAGKKSNDNADRKTGENFATRHRN